MLYIIYSHFDSELPKNIWDKYFDILPEKEKKKVMRFIRWQDRQAKLIGIMLIKKGLELLNLDLDIKIYN